jgi:hypothetical protein
MTAQTASRRFGSASSVTALVAGGLILALVVVDVPLARLAHQSLNASGGSSPVWYSAALGVVGFVVASRKPGNPLGWIMLAAAAVSSLSQDASFYMVADYRLRHGGLQDAAGPDSVQDELASTVQNALEPAYLSVWLRLEQEGAR